MNLPTSFPLRKTAPVCSSLLTNRNLLSKMERRSGPLKALDSKRRLEMPKTTRETLSGWQELASSLSANAADIPHLEGHRTQLADLLKQAQDLTTQQAALTASKQEVSKKLQGVMDEGKKIATFLRVGVRQHYGTRA